MTLPYINPSDSVHLEPEAAGVPQYLTRGGDVVTVPDWTGTGLLTFIENMIEGVLKQVFIAFGGDWDAAKTAATQLGEWAAGLLSNTWETLLTMLDSLFGGFDLESFLQPLFDFFDWAWNGVTAGFAGLGSTVNTVLKPLTEWLVWFWNQFSDQVTSVLNPIFTFLKWLFGDLFSGATAALQSIFTSLHSLLDGSGTLATWLAGLPTLGQAFINAVWSALNGGASAINKTINDVLTSIGDFAGQIIPAITGDPNAMGLGDVATWANNVLTKGLSWLDFKTLFGEIPSNILGVLPVSNINIINPELMTQGGFDSSLTLNAGNGWTYDATTTHSGTGGSAKVTGNGTARNLYSNQSISVTAGDKLVLTVYTKSSGTVGSGAVTLKVVEFNGVTQGTTRDIASTGSNAGWVQIGNTTASPYTVGSGVTTIKVALGVTSGAATGSSVWFDDISVRKVGLLSGDWMNGILGTVAQDIQSAVDQIIQAIKGIATAGTGNPLTGILGGLQSIFTTLFGPYMPQLPTNLTSNPLLANAIPGLNTSKITEGTFITDRIGVETITETKLGPLAVSTGKIANGAVTGGAPAAGGKLDSNTIVSANVSEVDGSKIGSGTVNVNRLPTTDISKALGTTGSGAKMSRRSETGTFNCLTGANAFPGGVFDTVDETSTDITASTSLGAMTVTHAGWYMVEVGFGLNSSVPSVGYFNVAPAIFLNGSTTPYKIGSDALGSYGGGFGNYAKSAQGSFIVYLGANNYITAGYYNYTAEASGFFKGKAGGFAFYFSISMLNRSVGG